MKKLAVYLKDYKKESILAPVFKMLEALFDLLVPLVVARIINHGIANRDRGEILGEVGLLVLLAVIGLTCSITAQYFAAKASVGFATNLRQALFDHVQSLSFADFDKLGTNTLITRMTSDINQVQNGLNMALRLLLRSPFIVFGSMIMAFTINVRCALVFVVAIPVLCVVVYGIMVGTIPLYRKVQAALDKLLGTTRENLTGVRVIRAFCKEQDEIEEFDQRNENLTRMNLFVGRISALMNPVSYALINIATIILIQQGAVQVNLGNMEQGDVVALYNYMAQIIIELIKLGSLIITINRSIACADRVAGVLDVKPGMAYPAGAAAAVAGSAPAVKFDHVTFTYQDAAAPSLTDIDFTANKGETIGIIGATGSGKSSLVNLIPRFYDVTEGMVSVDGQDVRTYGKGELIDRIGVVPQRAMLFEGSVRSNMQWGNENATDEQIWKALETAQVKDVVEGKEGKLDFEIEQGGRNLSGGQKQRLTIARALVKDPEILIMDDSSSALDFATDAALRKALRHLNKDMTVFIVSQRTSSILQADKIIVLDDGEVVGMGTHDELLENCKTYQEIFYSQFPEENPEYKEKKRRKISGKEALA